jgi:hypothetical protein
MKILGKIRRFARSFEVAWDAAEKSMRVAAACGRARQVLQIRHKAGMM